MCEEDKIAEPPKDIAADLMSAVTYDYLNPTKDTADEDGHSQLKLLAEDFGMTPIKVRKNDYYVRRIPNGNKYEGK